MPNLLILPELLDAAQAVIADVDLPGWAIHNKELITVMEDTLPAVVVWMLDSTVTDEDLSMDTPQLAKAQMVIELRSTMGISGSIIKTLAPTADLIYKAFQENDPFINLPVHTWGLRNIQTLGSSDNAKYCGLTLLFEINYMSN